MEIEKLLRILISETKLSVDIFSFIFVKKARKSIIYHNFTKCE